MIRWLLLSLVAGASLFAQEYQGKTVVKPTLLADTTAVVPGRAFKVGLLLETIPHWHTYWQYGGDAGFPSQIKWTLPTGFQAGPIEWPLPERLIEPGDIEVYAYGEKVLLITTIVVPADVAEKSITLKAKASWLVCAEICIPGKADLALTLPVQTEAAPANQELFQQFQALVPSTEPPPYKITWKNAGAQHVMTISGLGDARAVDVFPLPGEGQQFSHPKASAIVNGQATVELEAKKEESGESGETAGQLKPVDEVRGVLMLDTPSGRKGWYVTSGMESSVPTAAPAKTASVPALSLWTALLYGFLGGLILNLMPCVLPVISLKIFGFIKQAGDDPRRIFRHGLAFAGGIFAWFMALGLLIVILKGAGHEVTWAFQFQNPWFNLIIGCVVFVFALNLFGVFEIVLSGRTQTALSEATEGEGYGGSFFQGVFATLLATPCTAPFLGSALGFAFSQSTLVILGMFAAVAFGMAAPYLLLSAKPGWMKALPKPGAWMERVKQFMGFPLIATLLWLLYILGGQKGLEGAIWAAAFLLLLAIACWILGAFASPVSTFRSRLIAWLAILLLLGGGGSYVLGDRFVAAQRPTGMATTEGGIPWKPFSRAVLDEALASGQPVFVDFTADWCISCKFNERTAIDVAAVKQLVEEKKIIMIKADWTNADPEITAVLKQYGRVGVPFYLFYPDGKTKEPQILPELLTQQMVLDAFGQAR